MIKVFKLRILHDELKGFQREIEIKSNQTFLDFNKIIRQIINLKGNELASFFTCDYEWEKDEEITLLDMSTDGSEKFVMSDCTIEEFMDKKQERLIYEYNFLNPITFYIEVIDVQKPVKGVVYPQCVLKKGLLPTMNSAKSDVNVEEELLKDFDKMLKDEYNPDSTTDFPEDFDDFDD